MTQLTLEEGDWFCFRVNSELVYGIIARMPRQNSSSFLGFFFLGEENSDVSLFFPEDAILVGDVSTLSIKNNTWRRIGCSADWEQKRETWSPPVFLHPNGIRARWRLEKLNDELQWSGEYVTLSDPIQGFASGSMGSGYVEKILAKAIAKNFKRILWIDTASEKSGEAQLKEQLSPKT